MNEDELKNYIEDLSLELSEDNIDKHFILFRSETESIKDIFISTFSDEEIVSMIISILKGNEKIGNIFNEQVIADYYKEKNKLINPDEYFDMKYFCKTVEF